MKSRGKFYRVLSRAVTAAGLAALLSGCITSSTEDDYVAGVLAEAMQEFPPAAVMSGSLSATPAAEPAALAVKGAVSGTAVAPVTVVSPATVSVPLSAQPVGVQGPVSPKPAVSVAPAAHPGSAPATNETVATVLAPVMDPVGPAIPSPAEPTIQPDSVLWVSVSEDPSLNGRYLVNDASAIDFGYVGLVFLPDLSVVQAEGELKRVLEGRYLKAATVSVKMAKASYDKVGVQGSVEIPGEIKIGPGATISLSEALRRAGGLRGNRENCRVKIVKTGMKTPFGAAATGDVYSLVGTDGQLKVPEVYLRNDDLAYVFTPSTDAAGQAGGSTGATGAGGKRVVLLGEVPRRGVVEFSENEPCTLMYLLFKVGGLPRFAKANQITVVRRNKDGSEQKFLIDGEKIMNTGKPEDDFALETGDRIVVPARKISFF
jgi:protein involved in polysaccharide export with SLBB domain